MARIIFCIKLKKEAPGLAFPPFPNELGTRVFEQISEEAWQSWLAHQTMLINEYRLSMLDAQARQFLMKEMEKFLWGDGSEAPAGYVPS